MSNKDINTIVGDEFKDLSTDDMAMLTGRGSNDAAPASVTATTVTVSFVVTVSYGFATRSSSATSTELKAALSVGL